jgi:hypothetical protein
VKLSWLAETCFRTCSKTALPWKAQALPFSRAPKSATFCGVDANHVDSRLANVDRLYVL